MEPCRPPEHTYFIENQWNTYRTSNVRHVTNRNTAISKISREKLAGTGGTDRIAVSGHNRFGREMQHKLYLPLSMPRLRHFHQSIQKSRQRARRTGRTPLRIPPRKQKRNTLDSSSNSDPNHPGQHAIKLCVDICIEVDNTGYFDRAPRTHCP